MRSLHVLGYLLLLTLFTFSCRPEGEIVRADLDSFDALDQAKIGNTLSKHVLQNPATFSLYRPQVNQELYGYANAVLNTARNTMIVENRDIFNWEIFIERDEENISAYTMPGGKIFITSRFLRLIDSEAQFLSVIAHEMCYADTGISMRILQDDFSGLILGDIIFNNPVDELDDMVRTLQNTRVSEAQVEMADLFSIEIMCPFQYSTDGIATIIDNVSDNEFPLNWQLLRPEYTGRSDTIRSHALICGDGIFEEERYRAMVINNLD